MKTKINKLRAVVIITLANLLICSSLWAQAPQKISYQAVIRNSDDALVVETEIGMKISILQGSETGSAVYVETQTPTTNANGLVSIEIGGGAGFNTIDWASGPYYIKTETDPAGGTDYTIEGTSQLLSVPYALHAKTAEAVAGGITETDPVFTAWDKDYEDLTNKPDLTIFANTTDMNTELEGKVDKEPGKSLQAEGTQIGQMQYWNGTEWVIVAAGNEGEILTFISGVPTWKDSGNNGEVGEGDVQNPTTGKIWMDRNLGASQVATSGTDEDAYGDLYQWGRGTDGHEKRTSGTTETLSITDTPGHGNFILALSDPYDWRSPGNDDLWQGVDGINNPCPSGYRLPTEAEWEAERESWSSNDAVGAFNSPLKLPKAGTRNGVNNVFYNVGVYGQYWSSTIDDNVVYAGRSRHLVFHMDTNIDTAAMWMANRVSGNSVRCIKD